MSDTQSIDKVRHKAKLTTGFWMRMIGAGLLGWGLVSLLGDTGIYIVVGGQIFIEGIVHGLERA